MTDFVKEIHDTHHPLGDEFYYEDAKPEAKRFSREFSQRTGRRNISAISKPCSRKSGGPYTLGRRLSYVDLSLFQLVEGLRYAFPQGDEAHRAQACRGVVGVRDRVAARPRIKKYLASPRRIAFNEIGHFPALPGTG